MSTNITKKLAGKVALVTGGSRGIGAAIVKRLATDGADVTFSYAASADKANALLRELEDQGVKIAGSEPIRLTPSRSPSWSSPLSKSLAVSTFS